MKSSIRGYSGTPSPSLSSPSSVRTTLPAQPRQEGDTPPTTSSGTGRLPRSRPRERPRRDGHRQTATSEGWRQGHGLGHSSAAWATWSGGHRALGSSGLVFHNMGATSVPSSPAPRSSSCMPPGTRPPVAGARLNRELRSHCQRSANVHHRRPRHRTGGDRQITDVTPWDRPGPTSRNPGPMVRRRRDHATHPAAKSPVALHTHDRR